MKLEIEIYPLQKGLLKDIISPVGCNSLVAMMLAYYGAEKERKKSLERGYVKDIGSTVGIQSYRGSGTKGLCPGIALRDLAPPSLRDGFALRGAFRARPMGV